MLIKNNLKRTSGRVNIDHKVSKFFDISAKMNYAQTVLDRVANDNAFATPMQLIAQAPITPAYLEDGEPNPNTIYFNSLLAERYNLSRVTTARTIASCPLSYRVFKPAPAGWTPNCPFKSRALVAGIFRMGLARL